jgi:hypothetical protein
LAALHRDGVKVTIKIVRGQDRIPPGCPESKIPDIRCKLV